MDRGVFVLDKDILEDEEDIIQNQEDSDCEETQEESDNKASNKKLNKPKYFYDNYHNEFEALIEVPLIAVSRDRYEIIPYEYSDKAIRFRRNVDELDEVLLKKSSKLVLYCLENEIEKDLLITVAGGNLYNYNSMKKSFGRMSS